MLRNSCVCVCLGTDEDEENILRKPLAVYSMEGGWVWEGGNLPKVAVLRLPRRLGPNISHLRNSASNLDVIHFSFSQAIWECPWGLFPPKMQSINLFCKSWRRWDWHHQAKFPPVKKMQSSLEDVVFVVGLIGHIWSFSETKQIWLEILIQPRKLAFKAWLFVIYQILTSTVLYVVAVMKNNIHKIIIEFPLIILCIISGPYDYLIDMTWDVIGREMLKNSELKTELPGCKGQWF